MKRFVQVGYFHREDGQFYNTMFSDMNEYLRWRDKNRGHRVMKVQIV